MRSGRAKVLHRLGGLPLATWVIRAVRPLVSRTVVVVGHERDAVREALRNEGVSFVVQEEQLGTGHAMSCAAAELAHARTVLALAGDEPRLTTASLDRMLVLHAETAAAATMLTFHASDPSGYGRILRDGAGRVRGIVEDRAASEAERRIDEVNASLYAFETKELLPRLDTLPRRGHERYLTDVVERLVADHRRVEALVVPEDEAVGINTQAQLAAAEARYRAERAAQLMESGVTLVDPASVVVEADAVVGPGARLGPFVAVEGRSRIGARCEIGPFVRVTDAFVPDGTVVRGPQALEGGPGDPAAGRGH